jgi:hypothetical protein
MLKWGKIIDRNRWFGEGDGYDQVAQNAGWRVDSCGFVVWL